jgi:hypothetical protein
MRPVSLAGFTARSAWAPLPQAMGDGAIDFVSQTDDQCWLVASGPGAAPWPRRESPRPHPGGESKPGFIYGLVAGEARPGERVAREVAVFGRCTDDHGVTYSLGHRSSGANRPDESPRPRWDLRLALRPSLPADVGALRFDTPHGPLVAQLRPPVAVETVTGVVRDAGDEAAFYLTDKLTNHVWLRLLDPQRPLAPLGEMAHALVAVEAIEPDHPLVTECEQVDDAIGGQPAPGLLPNLASALADPVAPASAWLGATALGLVVDHPDGAQVDLEALVGLPDRTALHFLDPCNPHIQLSPWQLVVTALDSHGHGHVAHPEPLNSADQGAYHFRPPLPADATGVTVRLEGPRSTFNLHVPLDRDS